MNIGILTANRTNNNGTILQTAAMYRMFSNLVPSTEIIDYKCLKLERSRRFFYTLSIKDILKIPERIYKYITYENFRKKNFRTSLKTYDATNFNLNCYDVVIVGSDQIWNLTLTGNDLSFFLPAYAGNFRRFSYAASIGKYSVSEWDKRYHISKLLKKFECVTVRESSAIAALAKINIPSYEILDPILCLSKKEWEDMGEKKYKKKPYIVIYLVEQNDDALDFAREYASYYGYDIFRIEGLSKPKKGIKILPFISLSKWITMVSHAELVLTNSYHCLSMSIILEKNFRLFPLRCYEQNCRSYDLLNKLNLTQFITKEFSSNSIYKTPNWSEVNIVLDSLRKDSINYIKSIKGEVIC